LLSRLSFLAGLALAASPLAAQEKLISGPGSTLTETKCKICHELQHIRRSPLSRGEWADNLKNMKERGTPMTDAEMAVILDYLTTYYNREKPAPAPGPDTLLSNENPIEKLLNANACNGCHAIDRRIVGPSFQEVAAKYSAASSNELIRKIREGGQGAWGNVPMPPNPGLSEADAATLVAWVLQQN
jgi:cytochrome c